MTVWNTTHLPKDHLGALHFYLLNFLQMKARFLRKMYTLRASKFSCAKPLLSALNEHRALGKKSWFQKGSQTLCGGFSFTLLVYSML